MKRSEKNKPLDQYNLQTFLEGLRALDLTDEKGLMCGKVLGDLGVDVIKIEKPGGDPIRNRGPFYQDIPDPCKSLFWFSFNSNKRGITLDIETRDGREILKKLIKKSDFLIESFPPGYMENLGLGHEEISQINPGIIMTSITPFGQKGPYKEYKASDLTCNALSGYLFLCGDPDRPPVRISFPQTMLHASIEGAAASLIALYYREKSGLGQHIDVSIQQCFPWCMLDAQGFWDMNKAKAKRNGMFSIRPATNVLIRKIWPCKDGYISFQITGGIVGAGTEPALVKWMEAEGISDEFVNNTDWSKFDYAVEPQESFERLEKVFGNFFLTHTKAEIFEEVKKRRLLIRPVFTVEDICKDPQLKARNFWVNVEHPELNASIKYPETFIKSSGPQVKIRRRAPLIGEHNLEIYKEIGLSKENLMTLKESGVI